MVRYSFSFIAMASLAYALPLNINLGAYSPALVVGDGEISFGGEQDVSSLMNVLEGAAVNTAASVANGAAAAGSADTTTKSAPATTTTPATASEATTSVVVAAADNALTAQAQQIAQLQGMGKEISPRVDVETKVVEIEASEVKRRDLAGFDRALTFAEAALTKGPKIELGTGEGGSGIGITIDNTASKVGKRDLKRRAKVTTMYVRSGVPPSLQNKRDDKAEKPAQARAAPAAPAAPAAVPMGSRDIIDSLNLNVDGDQGLTMTFVEELDE